ncbi:MULTISPECIES: DUF3558 family protein [Gordonia]|nr:MULTISPECIES: DUF3558 family protein [Gordonia]MCM3894057.1 DUF3558 domain-containing protein [Gordonia sputi]NKY95195.1 DUF3558 family protein [Gordonia sputi]OBA36231.1 hypothetical protein A5766_09140 [Gordonia sp. 852002-51296_SCH5728562-b]
MSSAFSSGVTKTLLLSACLFTLSSCYSVDGQPRAEFSPTSSIGATPSTNTIRQTDDHGRSLPFSTKFPRRWSNGNDGTTYEPCTAATESILIANSLDPRSARDAAAADHQTARGCMWSLSDRNLASLSQFVGNQPDLDTYKQMNAQFVTWRADISMSGRRVAVSTTPSIPECTTFVRSGDAIVVTDLSISIDAPPINEICDKAIAFTRATIDQMPE